MIELKKLELWEFQEIKKHWEYDVVYSGLNLRLNDFHVL